MEIKSVVSVGTFLDSNTSGILRLMLRKMMSKSLHLHHPLNVMAGTLLVHVRVMGLHLHYPLKYVRAGTLLVHIRESWEERDICRVDMGGKLL